MTTARRAFAHDAVLVLDGDPAAPGAAITVALCGRWDHEPPCPLAPHHTAVERTADDAVRLRVLFAGQTQVVAATPDWFRGVVRWGFASRAAKGFLDLRVRFS